jgi:hypothetical protein
MISKFIQNFYAKTKMHGTGDAQVVLTDAELYALIIIALTDLNWIEEKLHTVDIALPSKNYYAIPLEWFEEINITITPDNIQETLSKAIDQSQDFFVYFENLCALHRRRVKFQRILATQPMPTMDQIGPRVLLEFGSCEPTLLANWTTWRKWIYDIDNRAAQETGYVFEPIIAACLGGQSVGAKNSPVKRIEQGKQTENGRQIDCYVPTTQTAYELKLRVTIAASGQGRFAEELSFPEECQAASITPILLVLDPTPSPRLHELSQKYLASRGEFYQGDDAWEYMARHAGDIISVFIERYIRPAIAEIENIELAQLSTIQLSWTDETVIIETNQASYTIKRTKRTKDV